MIIIVSSTDETYHVTIIKDGPFNGALTNDACLARNIRYLRYGGGL